MEIGIDPNIAEFGSFTIGWHGILMFMGIVVGVVLTLRLAKKAGISEDTIITGAIWAVIFGLIGARLSHVIDSWDIYSKDPMKILAFHEGGLGWYGALIGGILAVVIYSRIKKFSLGRFADAAAPGIILGLAIGRIGCTINGDAAGTPTSLPWAFTYTHPDAFAPLWIPTHPAPIYEILWIMATLGLLWWLKGKIKPDGSLFLVMLATYSFGRFIISWARDEGTVLGPLHQSHIISLVLFAAAVALLFRLKTGRVKPEPVETTGQETETKPPSSPVS
ncbi:MAG: prolipoprotein diacylglyceryl transferase [Chloroflexi bacterium RBG_13_53_26]|nr:MAG: prolipoprotein diacylglyceryl transferase [Chloroflexi bacterium RBG_13_53_26]